MYLSDLILLRCLSHVFDMSGARESDQSVRRKEYKYAKVLCKIMALCEQMASIGTNYILLPMM